MGKKTKIKQAEREAEEAKSMAILSRETARARQVVAPVPLVDDLAGYLDRAVRDPYAFELRTKSDNRDKQRLLLVRHAFVKYRPPQILDQAWAHADQAYRNIAATPQVGRDLRRNPVRAPDAGNTNLRAFDFRDWYIVCGTGKSLYKERTRGLMTKAETHFFTTCPHALGMAQGLFYAVARAQGARDGMALRIARSTLAEKPFQDDFWRDCARFFAHEEHHPTSLDQLNDLVDYLRNQHTENPNFRIFGGGHSLASLLRRMQDWHYALRRVKLMGNASWDGHLLDDTTIPQKIDGDPWFWDFTQIKNTKQLAAEGTAMRHCVFGYKSLCISGECSIWSLSLRDRFENSKRRVTIEVRNNGRIAQKRGLANRPCRAEENHIIGLWATRNGLSQY